MLLSAGDKLGPYEILASIGAGGMGEVYRARDPRLGRDIAIKVSAEKFSDRFEREARAIAALNHPNVCALYDVGPDYLVMELIEGETLKGPLPIETALDYAHQIADALGAAHEKGIIHRDLKPGNIKITPQGVVKVLDFGLAKRTETPGADPENSPTMTTPTRAGMIMGTAAYMSPEQARGKTVDKRADIWAFGVVLHEMVSGEFLFKGEDVSDTLAAVIKKDPDLNLVPAKLRPLLEKCLEKDPKKRLRDIGDWHLLLDVQPPMSPSGRAYGWLWPCVAGLLAIGLCALAFRHFREKPPIPAAAIRFQIPSPENAVLGTLLNVSPDGSKVAFLAGGRLWVHFFESGESRNLTEAGGTPFWSPDNRYIGYAAAPGKLKRIEATGGLPQTVTDYVGPWGAGSWNQDNLIVFSNRSAFFRVPAAGGVPVQIAALDPTRQETLIYSPFFLPDGRHFLYTRRTRDERKSAIYLGSVDAKPEQQSHKPFANSFWGARSAPSAGPTIGFMLFVQEDTLMAQPFDNRRLELTGQAAPVAEQISDGRAFSTSSNGVLVFQRTSSDAQLIWNDRTSKVLGTVGPSGFYRSIVLSPSGTRAALLKNSFGRASNIWLLDLSRGTSARFVFGSATETDPVWSPDEKHIVFSSNRDGTFNLYQKAANGERDEEVLLKSSEDKAATSWSRDGRFLLYTTLHPNTKDDIWVLPLDGERKPVPLLVTEFNERSAHFSPDGHWVAYVSDESGRFEVYVRSFSTNSGGTPLGPGGRWLVSSGGGSEPQWRSDGRELYYVSPVGRLMSVEIATNPMFQAGQPQPLGLLVPIGPWDSAADGKRFLISTPIATKPEPYTVILNWQSSLKN